MNAIIPATAQLVPIPMGAGIPETAAARAPSEFDDTIPAFSPDYIETEYLLAGTASTFAGPASGTGRRHEPRPPLHHPGAGPLSPTRPTV